MATSGIRAGVLSLQGSAGPHLDRLRDLGLEPIAVRQRPDLAGLTHLILPGGESTTLHHLLTLYELWQPIIDRARRGDLAIFGTCAGAILLGRAAASERGAERPPRMQLLDAVVVRNAYGSQLDSFRDAIRLDLPAGEQADPGAGSGDPPLRGVFIRAPRFVETGADVRVLATHASDPVLIESGNLLAATFHPELTDDLRIHRYFVRDRGPDHAASRQTASQERGTASI